MFDALKGLKEALARKEKQPEPRRILAEDAIAELNAALSRLEPGQLVTVVYYDGCEQVYRQLTGNAVKVDGLWKTLQVGSVVIEFSEIAQLRKMVYHEDAAPPGDKSRC